MAQVKRFCIDCGAPLTYYPQLSTARNPNEFRTLVYACTGPCTKNFETPKLFLVSRTSSDNPLKAVKLHVIKPRS